MYLNLPWELRHRINTFCVQGYYDSEVIVRRGIKRQPTLLVRQPVDTHSYRWVEDPILLQFSPAKIGLVASREMLETYYRTRTFKFVHEELGCVAPFIEKHGSDPSSCPTLHLRRLHLQIQPLKYAQIREPEAMRNEQDIYCQALESLVALRNPRIDIELHVNLAEGNVDEEELGELLNSAAMLLFRIIGIVEILRTRGLKVRLMLQGRWDERNGVELCNTTTTSFDDCLTRMKCSSQ